MSLEDIDGRTIFKVGLVGFLLVVVGVLSFVLVDITTIQGNQIGVKETWSEGVKEEPLQPKTYFLFPGFNQTVYTYDLGTRVFVMNNIKSEIEKIADGRELDAYEVQSQEGQTMKVSLNLRWRLDPKNIIQLHKNVRTNFEEKLIRPVVMRVVKDESTRKKAIEAYSGDGLVQLQTTIQNRLSDPNGELRQSGIIVENFVIEGIELDSNYINEIKLRQVAQQRQLRAVEETKASEAEALRAKAEAQSDLNRSVVAAQRDKEVAILKSEQLAQSQVLAAEADAKRVGLAAEADASKVKIAAEAEKEAAFAKAQAIEALGKAEAEAQKLKLSAYAVPGADAFVQIEVSKNMAEAFKNIQGYLPSDMSINLLSENFLKSVQSLVGKQTTTTVVPPVTATN